LNLTPPANWGRVAGRLELEVAAGHERVRAARVGEQALLVRRGGGEHGLGRVRIRLQALLLGRAARAPGAGRAGALGVAGRARGLGVALGEVELAADLGLGGLALLRGRVGAADLLQMRVGVGVAVDVLELDVAAEALVVAELADAGVVDGDHGRAGAGVDVDAPAVRALHDVGGVRGAAHLAARLLELAGVARLGADREVALRQAGERADEVGRQPADDTGAQEDRVDVPVGVVVGEDRAAQVLVAAGGAQVAGGGEDRIDGVERVLQAVVVGVDAVRLPRGGHELHPAQRARGGDVEVAAVVGLDLVDRGQDLPADAVLGARGLVDREQERRDAELVDEEVRHADRRRARSRERDARVGRGRRAVGAGEGSSGEGGRLLRSRGSLDTVIAPDLVRVTT
jgi:hypothetical protein